MAVGEIGFSVRPMGYDRNEVNEYISNLHRRMKDIETQSASGGERAVSSRIMEDAKVKIAAAQNEKQKLINDYEQKLNDMRGKADNLEKENAELKRKLQNSEKNGSRGAANDEEQVSEIIAEAEKTANGIIEKAKRTAAGLISSAQIQARKTAESGGGSGSDACAVMAAVSEFVNSVTTGFNALTVKTSGLNDSSAAAKKASVNNKVSDSDESAFFPFAHGDNSERTISRKSVSKNSNSPGGTEKKLDVSDIDEDGSDFSIFNSSLENGDTDDAMGMFSIFDNNDSASSGAPVSVKKTPPAANKTADKPVKSAVKNPDNTEKIDEADFSMFDMSSDSAGGSSDDSDDLSDMFAMFGGSDGADTAPVDKTKAVKPHAPKSADTADDNDDTDDSDDLSDMFAMFGSFDDADEAPADNAKAADTVKTAKAAKAVDAKPPKPVEPVKPVNGDNENDTDDSDDLMEMFAMFGGSHDADKAETEKENAVKSELSKLTAPSDNENANDIPDIPNIPDTSDDVTETFLIIDTDSADKTGMPVFAAGGAAVKAPEDKRSPAKEKNSKDDDEMLGAVQRLLDSAESDFGSISAPAKMTEPEAEPQSDPWADLQAQLDDEDDSGFESEEDDDPFKSLDDKGGKTQSDDSLWGFGGMSSNSDDMRDDIGGDIFGGF